MHNNIIQLQSQNGETLEEHQDIEKELLAHFKSVLQENQDNKQLAITKVLQHIPKLINEEHNQMLLHLVSL